MHQAYSPSSNMTTIKYNKQVGYLLIGTGIFFLILAAKLGFISYAIGLACFIRGCLQNVSPAYFSIDDRELCIYNFRGRKSKIYQYHSPQDFTVEKNKIYFQTNQRKQKLSIEKWLTDKDNWNSFIARIS